MTVHVEKTVQKAIKLTKLKPGNFVLDIASNDGTLLNFYPNSIRTAGIDPLINKYKKYYKKINFKISSFFSKNKILKLKLNKFKVITVGQFFMTDVTPMNFK